MNLTPTRAVALVAPLEGDSRQTGAVCFVAGEGAYWRLLVRGAVLLALTLGLYRFWLMTDIRRFLWSNTALAGQPFEYAGTAIELLLGFLLALALLVPVYITLFATALYEGPLGGLVGLAGVAMFGLLGPYAVYRARRYRLTRTVFRGIRFRQTGSAWRYALCALCWWAATVLTAGLAYPWMRAALEGFKMRHTFYGDLPGRFEASPAWLFVRGLPLWALTAGPLLASVAVALRIIDWTSLAQAVEQGRDLANDVDDTGLFKAVGLLVGCLCWSLAAAAMLYPTFQAITLRWWASGLRFGEVSLTSRLRIAHVYRTYLRFLGYGLLFSIVAGAGVGVCMLVAAVAGPQSSAGREAVTTGLLVVAYVIVALGLSTIYQVVVRLSLWRATVESLSVQGLRALDQVKAVGRPSSAVGEGLADALSLGGI